MDCNNKYYHPRVTINLHSEKRIMHIFKKYFGQNFLKSEKTSSKIVSFLNPETKAVVEIGPGQGALTKLMLDKGFNVYSVEIDESLYPYLEARFADYDNFHLIKADILQLNLNELNLKEYTVIGSLPYNISKKIIKLFLEAEYKPAEIIVMLQKEVAEDYAAKPPKGTFLANMVQAYGKCEYLLTVKKGEFYPEPKVDGGVIKIVVNQESLASRSLGEGWRTENLEKLVKFIKVGFSAPRKTLVNNLSNVYKDKEILRKAFEKLGINPKARAAELEFETYKKLYEEIGS